MTHPDHSALIEAWAATWSSGNVEQLLALFTDDCRYEDVTMQYVNEGRAALQDFAQKVLTAFPDYQMKLTWWFTTGDTGAAEWIATGIHQHDFPGLPATGNQFQVRGASVFEFRAGKICRVSDYWDLLSSGLLPSV